MTTRAYQKHHKYCRNKYLVEKTPEFTRERRVTANVKKCAVIVCNEEKVNPANFNWKLGGGELPIVDQYTYLGVET